MRQRRVPTLGNTGAPDLVSGREAVKIAQLVGRCPWKHPPVAADSRRGPPCTGNQFLLGARWSGPHPIMALLENPFFGGPWSVDGVGNASGRYS